MIYDIYNYRYWYLKKNNLQVTRPHEQIVKFRTVRTQKWEKPSTVVKKRTWTKQMVYKWLNSKVYGRYNELVNGGYDGL